MEEMLVQLAEMARAETQGKPLWELIADFLRKSVEMMMKQGEQLQNCGKRLAMSLSSSITPSRVLVVQSIFS